MQTLTKNFWKKKFPLMMVLFAVLNASHCAQSILQDFQKSSLYKVDTAYMPNIDVYIFRGGDGFELPPGVGNAAEYIAKIFSNSTDSIHDFQLQNQMAFYKSHIRYFYVRSDGLDNTYFMDFDNEPQTQATLYQVASLTLTNEAGSQNLGTVNVDYNRVVIFFTQYVHANGNVLGYATVGTPATISNPLYRNQYRIAISSGYAGHFATLKQTVSHELGHYFGLQHSFDDDSCFKEPKGSTRRIMDYDTVEPNRFIECERAIYKELARTYLYQTTDYKIFKNDNSPAYQKQSVEREVPAEDNEFEQVEEFYTGNWQGQIFLNQEVYFAPQQGATTLEFAQ